MIYVLSDIHGHKHEFINILKQIQLKNDDTLYILGDVVDKGENSIELLKTIMKMPNAKMLMGNHELMMLEYLDYVNVPHYSIYGVGEKRAIWYNNAGRLTEWQFRQEKTSTQKEIIAFLHSLPLDFNLTVHGDSYRLVHAAPREQFDWYGANYESLTQFAVWHRIAADEHLLDRATVIFGHTPTIYFNDKSPMEIWHGDGKIGMDCGCAYGGRLACLRLDDMQEFYSTAEDEE